MFQIKVAIALYEGNNFCDFIACAATGAGKTLTFWIPLLIALEDGMKDPTVILVTPLTLSLSCKSDYSCCSQQRNCFGWIISNQSVSLLRKYVWRENLKKESPRTPCTNAAAALSLCSWPFFICLASSSSRQLPAYPSKQGAKPRAMLLGAWQNVRIFGRWVSHIVMDCDFSKNIYFIFEQRKAEIGQIRPRRLCLPKKYSTCASQPTWHP